MVEGRSTDRTVNPQIIARIKNFISIQSAIEVDLFGQSNVETIRGKQFSAIGGSHDFLQGAFQSEGGKSILAMTSTAANGKVSRIISSLVSGTAIAHPRHSVDYIITEYGVASLKGKTLQEREKEMINIAHPDFRPQLKEASAKFV